jgi:hypothetical protein
MENADRTTPTAMEHPRTGDKPITGDAACSRFPAILL